MAPSARNATDIVVPDHFLPRMIRPLSSTCRRVFFLSEITTTLGLLCGGQLPTYDKCMAAENLLDDCLALPVDQRLDLVHRLWESLTDISLDLTDQQKKELDRRYDDYLKHPDDVATWQEVETYVLAKLKR